MITSSRGLVVLFTCGIAVCLTTVTSAQEWVARHNGLGRARAVAVDDSGYVYAAGWTEGVATSDDITTAKYSPSGDTLWVRLYNGPGNGQDRARSLAADDSGNVYVTGHRTGAGTSLDFTTIKYSPTGDTLWVRHYNGPANGEDAATGLAVDDAHNCYVTGRSWGGTNTDIVTIKYSPSGDTLWVRRYNGPGNSFDASDALAIDEEGSVYVAGLSSDGTSSNLLTIKYSDSGEELWDRHYNGPGNSADEARSVMVDDSGYIYLTGYSTGVGLTLDLITMKYTPSGDSLWVRRYDGPGDGTDQGWHIAVDHDRNVIVAGTSKQNDGDRDYTTIKYSASGDELWMRHYNGPGNGRDVAYALAVDQEANIYVGGGSRNDTSTTSAGYGANDILAIRYSPTGEATWMRRYNGPLNDGDVIWDMTVDHTGSVYAAAHSLGGTPAASFTVMKYSPCAVMVPGDVNTNGVITITDIIAIVNYVFKGGAPADPCEAAGDVDCSGACDSDDIIYTVNHVFRGGALPCDACNSTLATSCP